jgi:hypothetical protein
MDILGKILLAILAAPFVLFAVIVGGTLLVIALAVLAGLILMASVFRGAHGRRSASGTTFRFGVGPMNAAGRRPSDAFQEYAGGKSGRGHAETDLTLSDGVRWETVEDEDENGDGDSATCMACMGIGTDENGDACPTCGGEGRTES